MNLNEHLVARDMKKLEGEVRRMIKDFQKGNPYLLPDNWKIGGKNSEFAIEFKTKTGSELDEDIIKDEIVSELTFNMFRDIIYPKSCDDEKDPIIKRNKCLDAIINGHLYWVFEFEDYETYNVNSSKVSFGNLYVKLEPTSGNIYFVKSLHKPNLLDCDGEFTERDLSMVNLYDDYMNGKIK